MPRESPGAVSRGAVGRRSAAGPSRCGRDGGVDGPFDQAVALQHARVLAAQVERCHVDVAAALSGADGTFGDVAKPTVHAVDRTPDKMPTLLEGISRAATAPGGTLAPPATLIGVAALDVPGHLVAIEAIAVLD